MALDPFVAKIETSINNTSSKFHLPKLGPRGTKILIAVASGLMILSLISFAIFSYISTDTNLSKKVGFDANDQAAQAAQAKQSQLALPGGNIAKGKGGVTGTNAPVVTLTAEPASVVKGGTSKLKWSVTNNPKECIASDDWSGTKKSSGEETTSTLTTVQTYLFTLTCKTDTGTGFSTVSVGAISQTGGGNSVSRPTVTIAAVDTWVYSGFGTTITWSATNSPTSCTASGDWAGVKGSTGSADTGSLTTARNYTYTMKCVNASGYGTATATIEVRTPPANIPIVTVAATPAGPLVPGSSTTISWSATNSPTSCVASDDWSGARAASGSQLITGLSTIKTYLFTVTCSNGAGGTFDTAAIAIVPQLPDVALTATPTSIYTGDSSTLIWSSTNSPTSCDATGDWNGAKAASGSVSTGALTTIKTYSYSLQCANQGGTSAKRTATVSVSAPPAPVISLSASPISTSVGGSSNITWSATNSPTSCTASGDWSGTKAVSGTASTGTLNVVKTYSYTLVCSNAGGSDTATATVAVSTGGASSAPIVSISASPSSISSGGSSSLTWSATNSPTSCTASGNWSGSRSASGTQSTGAIATAGSYTYTLACTNAIGTGTASTTVTVVALPSISIVVSPTSMTTGSSATISWNVTGSTSCTAGGSWSGSKGASGSVSTGAINTAGSYSYSLSCTNSLNDTSSASATLTVTDPAPVYCGGLTPCYGVSDLAAHGTVGNCWGWNGSWVVNITTFRPSHKGGIKAGATSTLENASATCNHNINTILRGTASIPGYMDSGGATTHGHASATINNTGSSLLLGYRVGYYDATKP